MLLNAAKEPCSNYPGVTDRLLSLHTQLQAQEFIAAAASLMALSFKHKLVSSNTANQSLKVHKYTMKVSKAKLILRHKTHYYPKMASHQRYTTKFNRPRSWGHHVFLRLRLSSIFKKKLSKQVAPHKYAVALGSTSKHPLLVYACFYPQMDS